MNELLEKEKYPLGDKCRGIGIVIVNIFRKYGEYFRKGAGFEIEKLIELFTLMGLEVRQREELSKNEIVDLLKEVAKEERLKSDSMIAIAISSHGCEQGLLGINVENRIAWDLSAKGAYEGKDDTISPPEIRSIFNGINCPALAKKPKVLLLNGCRGGDKEVAINYGTDNVSMKELPEKKATTSSDFFTINSCQLGTISLRSDKMGSLFIDEFLSTYKDFGALIPLELLLPAVNRRLIDTCVRKVKDKMQSCNWESSCTSFLKIIPTDPRYQYIEKPRAQPTLQANDFKLAWATGAKGIQGPNQMSNPQGLTITPSGQIYITDPAAQCIWIYSTDGEPIYQDIKPKEYKQLVIENLGLKYAWGVCVFDNFLFVSCSLAITKFSMLEGGLLTHKIQGAPITGMDIDAGGNIYACERQSCNIILLDVELKSKGEFLIPSLNPAKDRLMDIKVLGQEMYLLISNNDYSIQVFDLKGTHIRNLVSKEDLSESLYFTINRTNRYIYAGDLMTNELKAFNENGKLMFKTGEHGDKRGNFAHPAGIDVTAQGEVVVVSSIKSKFMLQSFQVPPHM